MKRKIERAHQLRQSLASTPATVVRLRILQELDIIYNEFLKQQRAF